MAIHRICSCFETQASETRWRRHGFDNMHLSFALKIRSAGGLKLPARQVTSNYAFIAGLGSRWNIDSIPIKWCSDTCSPSKHNHNARASWTLIDSTQQRLNNRMLMWLSTWKWHAVFVLSVRFGQMQYSLVLDQVLLYRAPQLNNKLGIALRARLMKLQSNPKNSIVKD